MTQLATTIDTIQEGRWTLEQPADGYRFGSDAMLLAASVEARPGQRILELGCGVGAVLMAGAGRLVDTFWLGIEREAAYAELAQKNAVRNDLHERVQIVQGDVTDKQLFHDLGRFDHVVANPPYYALENHSGAQNDLRRAARQESAGDGLEAWLQAANRFLQPKGTITLIHDVSRLGDIIALLQTFAGQIRICPLWPKQGEKVKRILVQATKGNNAPLTLLPGLILHQTDASLTAQVHAAIIQGAALDVWR